MILPATLGEEFSEDIEYVNRWMCSKLRKGATETTQGSLQDKVWDKGGSFWNYEDVVEGQ